MLDPQQANPQPSDQDPKTNVASPTSNATPNINNRNMVFAIVMIVYHIVVIALFSTVYGFRDDAFSQFKDYGGVLLIGGLTMLLILGYGLINAYIAGSAVTGLVYTLILYCLTIEQFYVFRAFWSKAGTNDQINSLKTFDQRNDFVTLSNYGVDRQITTDLPSAPWVQGIACAIALNVAVGPVLGRVGLLEIFFLTLFGTFFYEVNAELLWRWFVTDIGFGYRIFFFGAIVGIFSTEVLSRKQTVMYHRKYLSGLTFMSYSLLGFLILWCAFPLLSITTIYTQSPMDNLILFSSPITVYLALVSGVLGTFTISAINYRKFSVHDLVFTGLTGGIIFSSSADVNWNPSVPMVVGYIIGMLGSFRASKFHRINNQGGIIYAQPHYGRYLLPGATACILVAILHGLGMSQNGQFQGNYFQGQQNRQNRSFIGQGAFQILAILITGLLAAGCGILIGLFYRLINRYQERHQYEDNTLFIDILPYEK